MDITQVTALIVNGLVLLIFGGYIIVGLMLMRQINILCKILGTALSPMLQFTAFIHIVFIVVTLFIVLILT